LTRARESSGFASLAPTLHRVKQNILQSRRASRAGIESLAVKGERLQRMPYIEMLTEHNTRRGFFERPQFEAVRAHLPAYAQPAATFAYITGWRLKSEILTLQWRQVGFRASVAQLEPGTTKNREGRTFPMTPELRALLEAQRPLGPPSDRRLKANGTPSEPRSLSTRRDSQRATIHLDARPVGRQ
jgi:integrase